MRSRAAADQSDALGFLLDWFAEEAAGEAPTEPQLPEVANGWVLPHRVLPLDMGSELAREQAALCAEQEAVRKQRRERLRDQMVKYNELIENPKFKLSLT